MFDGIFQSSIIKRAQDKKLIQVNFINPRDFAKDKHKTVDDTPYGGGSGMVMKADILVAALESIKPKPYTILLSASGKRFTQQNARSLSKKKNIALICGHYEGVDARVEQFVDETLSIGDFVLTGGEVAAMAIVDSTSRLIPGVIHPKSLENESFSKIGNWKMENGKYLEYPQYTKPEDFRGLKVPKVLLSGNHKEIKAWRDKESKRLSKARKD
ncbi:MAG: tRNA (guanosine(37)-N1)-methyltransferase TrmD [Candidatus Curtissbacteria bacterium]|nr:tRNA (guanosine(37)-N1)-methyltransferase TrmD [Candidatus Curtissbacteria bacterium]